MHVRGLRAGLPNAQRPVPSSRRLRTTVRSGGNKAATAPGRLQTCLGRSSASYGIRLLLLLSRRACWLRLTIARVALCTLLLLVRLLCALLLLGLLLLALSHLLFALLLRLARLLLVASLLLRLGLLLALVAYVPVLGFVAPVLFGLAFIRYLLGALAEHRASLSHP